MSVMCVNLLTFDIKNFHYMNTRKSLIINHLKKCAKCVRVFSKTGGNSRHFFKKYFSLVDMPFY